MTDPTQVLLSMAAEAVQVLRDTPCGCEGVMNPEPCGRDRAVKAALRLGDALADYKRASRAERPRLRDDELPLDDIDWAARVCKGISAWASGLPDVVRLGHRLEAFVTAQRAHLKSPQGTARDRNYGWDEAGEAPRSAGELFDFKCSVCGKEGWCGAHGDRDEDSDDDEHPGVPEPPREVPDVLKTMTPEQLAVFKPISDEAIVEALAKGERDRHAAMNPAQPPLQGTPPDLCSCGHDKSLHIDLIFGCEHWDDEAKVFCACSHFARGGTGQRPGG